MIDQIAKLAVPMFLIGMILVAAVWPFENVRLEEPACPRGIGHGFGDLRWLEDSDVEPPANEAQKLLSRPNFGATPEAAGDLKDGIVDDRLVSTLLTITEDHSICVRTFKEGHSFLPGVEDGPTIPEGYGEAGGLPNTHYFGRATDIYWVDGEPIEGNGTQPAILDVGRMLANIPPRRRPGQIIGPPGWTRELGYGLEEGWVTARDQVELHEDHIHIGYRTAAGNNDT